MLEASRTLIRATANGLSYPYNIRQYKYPRDVVSAVLATATWLAGCHTPVLYQYR